MSASPVILLSVIVPTRNRAGALRELLASLQRQARVDFSWDVVVVDNGSTDETAAVVASAGASAGGGAGVAIRRVVEARPGLHHARHAGARATSAAIVSYLDDDMVLEPGWVGGAAHLAAGRAEAVVGRIRPRWQAPPPRWLTSLFEGGSYPYLGLLDLGDRVREVDPLYVFGGGCFLVREMVLRLGGFHPDGVPGDRLRFRGDGETALMSRFAAGGHRAIYEPACTAWHVIPPERMTVEYLCRRAYNQGISDSFTQLREEHGRSPRRVERARPLTFARIARGIRRRVERAMPRRAGSGPGRAEIERRLAEAYRAGFAFHRAQVSADAALLEYVLRADYLDEALD